MRVNDQKNRTNDQANHWTDQPAQLQDWKTKTGLKLRKKPKLTPNQKPVISSANNQDDSWIWKKNLYLLNLNFKIAWKIVSKRIQLKLRTGNVNFEVKQPQPQGRNKRKRKTGQTPIHWTDAVKLKTLFWSWVI